MFTMMSKSEDLPRFNGESRGRNDSQRMDWYGFIVGIAAMGASGQC